PPMFWLNSRGSLVTATSRSRGWHPLYRRYGANLPNSLAWIFADTPWASHPGAPVSVLGTVARIDPNALFTGTTDQRKGLRPYSLRRSGSPPHFAPTPPRSSFERGPPDLTARLRPAHDAPLQDHLSVLCSIGDGLKPRPFSGPMISAGELLRYL